MRPRRRQPTAAERSDRLFAEVEATAARVKHLAQMTRDLVAHPNPPPVMASVLQAMIERLDAASRARFERER